MTPTREAGISICVYRPNQAKYRAIFSPKYFLKEAKTSGPGSDFQRTWTEGAGDDSSHRTSPMGWYLKKTP